VSAVKVEKNFVLFFLTVVNKGIITPIDIEGAKIDCLSLFMFPLLAQLIIGFFSFFAAAVYSTNAENTCRLAVYNL
jgi:hypothetical protein